MSLTVSSKAFNFAESTPSSEVGNLIEEAFWTCNKDMSIDILSSEGVLPSHRVRVSVEDLGFVDRIATLPTELAGFGLIKRLREYGVLTDVTVVDVKSELEGKALNVVQLVSPPRPYELELNIYSISNVFLNGLDVKLVIKTSKAT